MFCLTKGSGSAPPPTYPTMPPTSTYAPVIVCQVPPEVANARLLSSIIRPIAGDRIEYECNPGFAAVNPAHLFVECLSNGFYSDLPMCREF